MKTIKYIICPEHGKIVVNVEEGKHREYFTRETAKCPRCNKRLEVHKEVSK
jgi:uncharacterized protein with PIN domain